MADIASVNGVPADNIGTVHGVAKAAIAKFGGADMPAGGASLWVVAAEDGGIATAAAADLNDWTGYDATGLGNSDHLTIAVGEDGSGGPRWVVGTTDGNMELRYSDDPTAGVDWNSINIAGDVYGVGWGNGVWISVGQAGELHRSTDGASWTRIDLSATGQNVAGWTNTVEIYEVVTDGAGNWMCCQGANIFGSTDDGATWARLVQLDDAGGLNIGAGFTATSMAYTASRWSVYLWAKSPNRTLVCHAAAADPAAWAICTVDGSPPSGQALIGKLARRMAGGDGTVIITYANAISRSTDGGQDWTLTNGTLPRMDARDVATDGQGNWVIVHDAGRISVNTNDGAPGSWAEQTGGQLLFPSSTENIEAVAMNVPLPV